MPFLKDRQEPVGNRQHKTANRRRKKPARHAADALAFIPTSFPIGPVGLAMLIGDELVAQPREILSPRLAAHLVQGLGNVIKRVGVVKGDAMMLPWSLSSTSLISSAIRSMFSRSSPCRRIPAGKPRPPPPSRCSGCPRVWVNWPGYFVVPLHWHCGGSHGRIVLAYRLPVRRPQEALPDRCRPRRPCLHHGEARRSAPARGIPPPSPHCVARSARRTIEHRPDSPIAGHAIGLPEDNRQSMIVHLMLGEAMLSKPDGSGRTYSARARRYRQQPRPGK